MSRLRLTLAGEGGFTLVEMLVTIGIGMIVLSAILGASEIFARSASVTDKTTAAQEAARVAVRSMVHELRQARKLSTASTPIGGTPTRSDLVVATYVTSSAGAEVAGWVRYCATSDAHPSLVFGTREVDAYAAPGACSASDTTNGWTHRVMLNGTLQDAAKLFDYTTNPCSVAPCATPTVADIQSVGIRVAVGTSPTAAATLNSVLRDAVSFRNRSST
jgi:type II secretory pathway pseudopilin PulG